MFLQIHCILWINDIYYGQRCIADRMGDVMRYLKRKIDIFLEEWKQDIHRKPLIVKGPRQVGKTESIRNFGTKHYAYVVEINFVEEPKY